MNDLFKQAGCRQRKHSDRFNKKEPSGNKNLFSGLRRAKINHITRNEIQEEIKTSYLVAEFYRGVYVESFYW